MTLFSLSISIFWTPTFYAFFLSLTLYRSHCRSLLSIYNYFKCKRTLTNCNYCLTDPHSPSSLSLIHTRTLFLPLTLTHKHTCTHSLSLTHSHSNTRTHTHSNTLKHSLPRQNEANISDPSLVLYYNFDEGPHATTFKNRGRAVSSDISNGKIFGLNMYVEATTKEFRNPVEGYAVRTQCRYLLLFSFSFNFCDFKLSLIRFISFVYCLRAPSLLIFSTLFYLSIYPLIHLF